MIGFAACASAATAALTADGSAQFERRNCENRFSNRSIRLRDRHPAGVAAQFQVHRPGRAAGGDAKRLTQQVRKSSTLSTE
jgi:hypothetical protein